MNENDSGKDKLWTPADLAERWQCTASTALDRVRRKGVPYVWLGRGEPKLDGRGAKMIRFRPRAIEAWEAQQEGYWSQGQGGEAPKTVAASGLIRGRNARRN